MKSTLCALGLLALAQSISAETERVALQEGKAEMEIAAPEKTSLRLRHPDGDVLIVGHDRATVILESDLSRDDREGQDNGHLLLDRDRGEIEVRLRGDALDEDLRLTVPRKIALNLQLSDGELEISGILGAIEVRNVDGDTIIHDAAGAVVVDAVDGDVEVSIVSSEPGGPIALSTVDGDVRLTIPRGFGAELDLSTFDGSVDLALKDEKLITHADQPHFKGGKRKHEDFQQIKGTLNGGGPLVMLRTVDGDLQIRVK